MDSEILLSIVTVSFNDRDALAKTLASCRLQSSPEFRTEILVVDGGSDDGTVALVEAYGDIVSRFTSEPDGGIYDAMNKGLKQAVGSYVMYLNAGDVWHDDKSLRDVVKELAATRPAWLVGLAMHLGGGTRYQLIENLPHSWIHHAFGLQPHCHQVCFVRRDILLALDGFSADYDFAGDYDLILRLGLMHRPAEFYRVIADYEGGGVSAVNGGMIPRLQHMSRVDRFGLGARLATLDAGYMRYQLFRRRIHPRVRWIKCRALKLRRLSLGSRGVSD